MNRVIIALGSNTQPNPHIHWASQRLSALLDNLRFSRVIWTKDIHETGVYYMNRLACGTSPLSVDALQQQLKDIEAECGRSSGHVTIDLDLMQFNERRLHQRDWSRPYIQQLLGNLKLTRKQRYDYLIGFFLEHMPQAQTELEFESVFQLLVAVVLSAQCTDKRVNMITPELFRCFPDAQSMAASSADEVYEYISSVSYPNSKAKHLVNLARVLVEKHGGEVPDTMDDLLALPGVGRKTANVVQSVAFGKSAMAVDTHVYRVSHRLGLVPSTADNPYKVEQWLVKNIPAEYIPQAHHWLILHGRYVCTSRSPHCRECMLSAVCPSAS